jgi:hypothetical protein
MKALHCIVPVLMGILTGSFHSEESIASEAVPIVKINPSTNSTFDEAHGDGMVGWSFQLIEPFTITQVGWYATNANGLSRPFQVGLWEGGAGSLIGDPTNGLIIPAGTNATLLGSWRVIDLAEPLVLPPGFYDIGGFDTSATTDVIKYVSAGNPGYQAVAPPGSPVLIGPFFYGTMSTAGVPPKFGPPTEYYLWWGLELGPMLFGTNGPGVSTGSGLRISHLPLAWALGPGTLLMLTWPTGALQQADFVTGPYTTVTNGASPYIVPPQPPIFPPSPSFRKFYRLGP